MVFLQSVHGHPRSGRGESIFVPNLMIGRGSFILVCAMLGWAQEPFCKQIKVEGIQIAYSFSALSFAIVAAI